MVWILVLLVIIVVLIWHVSDWHTNEMHTRLLEMVEEGKAYISALYNIGLIVLTAVTLGLLIGKITDLISHDKQTLGTTDTTSKVDPE